MSWVVSAWHAIEEPRVRKVLWSCLYGAVATAGAISLIVPPQTVEDAIGQTLTVVWGVLLLTGGLIGGIAHLTPHWWAERIGIVLSGTGALCYLAVVLYLHMTSPGNRLVQACFISAYVIALAIRWGDIAGWNQNPMRRCRRGKVEE